MRPKRSRDLLTQALQVPTGTLALSRGQTGAPRSCLWTKVDEVAAVLGQVGDNEDSGHNDGRRGRILNIF